MTFLTEAEPPRGVALDVLPGIRRVVARNPSVMTYHGTNTYLVARDDGLTVIDPGPDDKVHVADILRAAGDTPITRLVITHAHNDHYGATKALQAATGAPSWGYHTSGYPHLFTADHLLDDAGEVAGLKAVFTPGHAADHLSFAYDVPGTGQILFSGDHVMAWSSSIVNPPHGNMRAYYRSLELLLARQDLLYLPGHGPVEANPRALVESMLEHRKMREATILAALQVGSPTIREIAKRLYAKTDAHLQIASERNVLSHLLKLQEEALVVERGTAQADDIDEESSLSAYFSMVEKDALRQFVQA